MNIFKSKEHNFRVACRDGDTAGVYKALSRSDVQLNAVGSEGRNGLHFACLWGHADVVRALIADARIDVNARDAWGATGLMAACAYGRLNVIDLLVADGRVDLGAFNDVGDTALDIASKNGQQRAFFLLLDEMPTTDALAGPSTQIDYGHDSFDPGNDYMPNSAWLSEPGYGMGSHADEPEEEQEDDGGLKGVALYDFKGIKRNNEISFKAGDIITDITYPPGDNHDWVTGTDYKGNTGLFPLIYVRLENDGWEDVDDEDIDDEDTPPGVAGKDHENDGWEDVDDEDAAAELSGYFQALDLQGSLPDVVRPNGPKVALCIGNAAYRDSPLANPANDARDVATVLRRKGYKTIVKVDASYREMRQALDTFTSNLGPGGVAFFYFSGHGMQGPDGKQYLIPIESVTRDTMLEHDALSLERVYGAIQGSGCMLHVVVADACRANPLPVPSSTRSLTRGFAAMPAPTGAKVGSVLAYSCAPGTVAFDAPPGSSSRERNGAFTTALLKHLETDGLHVGSVFIRTANDVLRMTGGRQEPWRNENLRHEHVCLY